MIANILARPLIQLAPLLASSIRHGGRIVLAGLLERQQEEVRAAYAPWFTFEPDQTKEGWTRISASCRQPAIIALHRFTDYLGTGGQPQALHFPLLAQEGYTHVINLATPLSPNHLKDESAICAQYGLRYSHLPVDGIIRREKISMIFSH